MRISSSFSILRMEESRLLLRPSGAVQFEAVLKGFIDRFGMPEEIL